MIGRWREVGSCDVWMGFAVVKREDGYLINIYKVVGKGEYCLSFASDNPSATDESAEGVDFYLY
ncbi:unnamed protein product [Prunus armeniaca]|uniref:Uncharacterized protein n=1 Tax=Prunus armeniaca TaxID=36596 RepID=A0A6J5V6P4_PRUAR|nr:unnamed protein product [Prunus armeniaca]